MKYSKHPVFIKFGKHVNPAFVKLLDVLGYGRNFVKAKDVWVWDDQGKKYLDALAGFGSVNIGHNHPRLISYLQDFLGRDELQFCHIGPAARAADLAEAIARKLPKPLEVSMFSSSGGEAVEAGLKLARAATGRSGFAYCRGGFHGTNLGNLSVMGEPRMRAPFEPLLADCTEIAFGDLAALESALSGRKYAGFLVEPIQCEAGIIFPPEGYLAKAQELCRKYGTLMILDEVQTGFGRTGTWFAFEAENFVPDVLVLAKSLSGGIAPIAATVTSGKIHQKAYGAMDRFDLHMSTFGGNAMSCACAIEAIRILDEEHAAEQSRRMGARLQDGLRRRLQGHPLVKDIRGRGLLVAVELGPTDKGWINSALPGVVSWISEKVFGQWLALELLENGIIMQPASQEWNVLRFEPPLMIKEQEVDQIIETFGRVMDQYQNVTPILKNVAARIAGRRLPFRPDEVAA